MDRLARDAAVARAAGMSYGKYIQRRKQTVEAAADLGPRRQPVAIKVCEQCGREFPAYDGHGLRRRYCCDACKKTAANKRRREKGL